MSLKRILIGVLIIFTAVALLLPLTASATSWSAPFSLGTSAGGKLVGGVAIDPGGNAHYVWWQSSVAAIQYRKCDINNVCGSTQGLPNNGNAAYYPSIAINPQGYPNVIWMAVTNDTAHYGIYFSKWNGASWTAAQRLSTEVYAQLPDIAIGPTGIIHVSYVSWTTTTIYYVESTDGGSSWHTPLPLVTLPTNVPLPPPDSILEAPELLISSGVYHRISVDSNDHAYVVWNAPSYGIYYKHQTGASTWSGNITVAAPVNKDQTPDITVDSLGRVGVVWSRYDTFHVSFAEFVNDVLQTRSDAVDGGLFYSLWPKISSDCGNNFHIVFQGQASSSSTWDIKHRQFDGASTWGSVETIASTGYQEQTPVIDTTNLGAIIYANTSLSIVDASTANLGITCGGPTPTASLTATATPPSTTTHIPDTNGLISYSGLWTQYSETHATDGEYKRCGNASISCTTAMTATLHFTGYRIDWETAYANTYGKAQVVLDGSVVDTVDLCAPNSGSSTPQFATRSYNVSGDPLGLHTILIKALGTSTSCSLYTANYVVVDGFDVWAFQATITPTITLTPTSTSTPTKTATPLPTVNFYIMPVITFDASP